MKRLATLATAIITIATITIATYATEPTLTPVDGYPAFALGADVSWTPYIERNNLHTYYRNGGIITPDRIITIPEMISDHGIDAVRLRVWVDPTTEQAAAGFRFKVDGQTMETMGTFGTCTIDEMTTLAHRFAARGQRVMVSFQMSDVWADPAHQFIPASWADCTDIEALSSRAADHVCQVLTLLRQANVNVAWAQIGNETNNGMLEWRLPASDGASVSVAPYGCQVSQSSPGVPSATTYNFVKTFNACADAARAIFPEIKTICHLTKTAEWETLNWSLDLMVKAGLDKEHCDYIGLSLYPGIDDGRGDYTADWQIYADRGIATIANIYSTYGMRTMLCEIGMNNEYTQSITVSDPAEQQGAYIAQCNTDVSAFTKYLIDNLDRDGTTCDGLFYWEPETDYMKEYTKGACVSVNPGPTWPRYDVTPNAWWTTVKAHSTFPLGGLKEYDNSGIDNTSADNGGDAPSVWYDINGRRLPGTDIPDAPGVYIQRQGAKTTKRLVK